LEQKVPVSDSGLHQSGIIDGKHVEYDVNGEGKIRLIKIDGVDVEHHVPSAEAPKAVAPETHHAPPAEAQKPPAVEAHVSEALNEYNFDGGKLKLVRDAAGKIKDVIVVSNAPADINLELFGEWQTVAMEHNPNLPASILRSGLIREVTQLHAYREAAGSMVNKGGAVADWEVLDKIYGKMANLAASIEKNYGKVLRHGLSPTQ